MMGLAVKDAGQGVGLGWPVSTSKCEDQSAVKCKNRRDKSAMGGFFSLIRLVFVSLSKKGRDLKGPFQLFVPILFRPADSLPRLISNHFYSFSVFLSSFFILFSFLSSLYFTSIFLSFALL